MVSLVTAVLSRPLMALSSQSSTKTEFLDSHEEGHKKKTMKEGAIGGPINRD